jgi:mannose-6-phosphate isomerase-like protein (cupin superfamily)
MEASSESVRATIASLIPDRSHRTSTLATFRTPASSVAAFEGYGSLRHTYLLSSRGDCMSRFAKVNLLEVEDSVAGRVEGLEGRYGRKYLDSRDLGVSLFRYAPNLRSPMAHSHKEQEEAYVVVAGSGRILLDDETQELRTWDVIPRRARGCPSIRGGPRRA